LGRAAFDIHAADTEVFDMPMELGLELMTIIGSDFSYPEWELGDDVIDKVLSVSLDMPLLDFERANAGRVINGGILEAAYFLSPLSDESQKRNVHLGMMSRDLFVPALDHQLSRTNCSAIGNRPAAGGSVALELRAFNLQHSRRA
jgi:hypothetical protein